MTCPRCGRYAPMDPETGYDADEFCRECLKWLEELEENEDELFRLMELDLREDEDEQNITGYGRNNR